MKHTLFATCLCSTLMLGGGAAAQTGFDDPFGEAPTGKAAGSILVRLRAIGLIPEDNSSSTSIGGHVDTSAQAAPEADFSYFFTDNVAVELIAATTRHTLSADGTAIGKVDVGSTWVLPPTVTLQYHFMPKSRFSPYIGAGLNWTLFYSGSPATPVVKGFRLDNNFGAAVQVGADYNFTGRWFANIDVKQIFLNTTAHLNTELGPVTAKTSLDPLVVGVGIGYRF